MVVGSNIAKFSVIAVVAFGLGGCDSDTEAQELPAGWEDAERVSNLIQHECAGTALVEHDERATFVTSDGSLDVRYEDAHFRCEQDVEGFFKDSGDALDILVQPVDMNPSSPTRCDCLYEITFAIAPLAGSRQATLFRRWDDLNEPNDPVEIASETVAGE
ncbi:MAG TPA: hypothetical protein VMS65_18230 [Polyangiaceae bacterium]|nr:hypothetical protein [Polyangiaceae bacterium]